MMKIGLKNRSQSFKWYFFSILLVSLQLVSCSEKKLVTPDEAERQLIFNHGGGFAGKYKTFYLLENGQLFKGKDLYGSSNAMKSLPKNITEQIFSNYDVLGLGEKQMTSYGNFNYTLIYKDAKGEKKSVWEKNQGNTESLQLFYQNVMQKIKVNNGDSTKGGKKPKFDIQ